MTDKQLAHLKEIASSFAMVRSQAAQEVASTLYAAIAEIEQRQADPPPSGVIALWAA